MADTLTDRQLKALKAGEKPRTEPTRPGLIYVPSKSANGRGNWLYRFTSPETGKRREMGIGGFPDVPSARARDLADERRRSVKDGVDPIEAEKREAEAKAKAANVLTFERAARATWANLRPGWKREKHATQWLTTLETYVFPLIGDKPVAAITSQDCDDVLRPIWLTKEATAAKVRQRMDATMSWALAHKHVTANPCDVLDHLLPNQKARTQHQPSMPWRVLPAFVRDHLAERTRDMVRSSLLFAILTAARSNEACAATWAEIDLDGAVWTIPAERMKMNSPHRVPLAPQAVTLLRKIRAAGLHASLVFPSATGKAMSHNRLTELLRALEAPSDVPGRAATTHGFRSTFRDWCGDTEQPRDLAERALAHTVKGVEGAYARSDLLERRVSLMATWADHACGPALRVIDGGADAAAC
jgi:integrase